MMFLGLLLDLLLASGRIEKQLAASLLWFVLHLCCTVLHSAHLQGSHSPDHAERFVGNQLIQQRQVEVARHTKCMRYAYLHQPACADGKARCRMLYCGIASLLLQSSLWLRQSVMRGLVGLWELLRIAAIVTSGSSAPWFK